MQRKSVDSTRGGGGRGVCRRKNAEWAGVAHRFLRRLPGIICCLFFLSALSAPVGAIPVQAEGSTSTGLSSPTAEAEDQNWPQFRGPDSLPVSDNPKLPVSWSTTENVEWVSDVPGVGWSSPIVWGDRIFLTSATSDHPMKQPSFGTDFGNDYLAELHKQGLSPEEINRRLYARDREMPYEVVIQLTLYCYALESGKQLWQRSIFQGHPLGGKHRKNSFASETPVTDGERVYAYFTHHGLFAFDFQGNSIWTTPLQSHATVRDYGTGASPILYGDRLYVLNDNEEASFLAAFDKETGKEIWRTGRAFDMNRKTGWSTPFVWENPQRSEIVTYGPGEVISYTLEGKEIWKMSGLGGAPIQSPFAWNGLLFVTSGTPAARNKPLVAIRPGASGDITLAEGETSNEFVAWYDRVGGGTYLPTPVVYRGSLYVLTSNGIFTRWDAATGERLYRARVSPGADAFTTSPWAYNGRIFALGEDGSTYVIKVGEEYKVERVNQLDEFTLASPAIVGDRLLIRTQSHLYSILK